VKWDKDYATHRLQSALHPFAEAPQGPVARLLLRLRAMRAMRCNGAMRAMSAMQRDPMPRAPPASGLGEGQGLMAEHSGIDLFFPHI